MKEAHDHIVIKLIEFGINKGVDGFTSQEYDAWKKQANISTQNNKICNKLLHQCFSSENRGDGVYVFLLNADQYFNYIDYIELKEARKNSKDARNFSILAIILSIISILIACFGEVKLNKNSVVNLSDQTIHKLTEKNK